MIDLSKEISNVVGVENLLEDINFGSWGTTHKPSDIWVACRGTFKGFQHAAKQPFFIKRTVRNIKKGRKNRKKNHFFYNDVENFRFCKIKFSEIFKKNFLSGTARCALV